MPHARPSCTPIRSCVRQCSSRRRVVTAYSRGKCWKEGACISPGRRKVYLWWLVPTCWRITARGEVKWVARRGCSPPKRGPPEAQRAVTCRETLTHQQVSPNCPTRQPPTAMRISRSANMQRAVYNLLQKATRPFTETARARGHVCTQGASRTTHITESHTCC